MKKILVLTSIYPGKGVKISSTPVVHYFVKEWVKNGVDVRVIHYPCNFPRIMNLIARPFSNIIGSKMGTEVRTWQLPEAEYGIDGVKVKRIPLTKFKPHGRYGKNEIAKAIAKTIDYCEKEVFVPDIITSHWVNPQFEIMHRLKEQYGCKTCYVAHDSGNDLLGIYKREAINYLKETDVIGYRSDAIKRAFEKRFHTENKPHFYCFNGIPSKYVEKVNKTIEERNTILFVGTLIERKYPTALIKAASLAFQDEDFQISFIGEGREEHNIKREAELRDVLRHIHLIGRVQREEVVKQMDSHALFVMISRAETFGLVYLEAMARGCITIASRDEGFDGIIRDGVNGFLCKAGDSEELATILKHIKFMPKKELQEISQNAIRTAQELTDEKAAYIYLKNIIE